MTPTAVTPAGVTPAGVRNTVGVSQRRIPAATDGSAVEVLHLTKRYGRRTVVDGLQMRIPTGAIAGFVGPNGAGKTTTLRMLLGLVRPSAGEGSVLGEPLTRPQRYLSRVGALIESPALYPGLSGEHNLAVLAALGGHDRARIPEAIAEVGLAGRGGDAFRTYSLGMKQRLAIAAALLADPDLLVLDEPTNGLDPTGIQQMRELLRGLAQRPRGRQPRTVLVSSHLLAEVEQICDWIVVVERGRLAYHGPIEGLMAAGSRSVLLRPQHPDHLGALAELTMGRNLSVRRDGDRLRVDLPSGDLGDLDAGSNADSVTDTILAELNRDAFAAGITLVEITPVRVSLEERYRSLVDKGMVDHVSGVSPEAGVSGTSEGSR
ncbi:ABC transporter ATP-binding protein [Protofrankia symbiont of Coriaria ruscifolia]|uniref:ABC transporter ATP-binding protein n=1 Tax=Protofrankia symbiont of Coriaria ruscifolia TaxID=1306542 RepID=UPI001040EF5F|nr:ATP-binding cassette domain-containing protein [Protofrankia symbiont of Coriaria ruscifolia]